MSESDPHRVPPMAHQQTPSPIDEQAWRPLDLRMLIVHPITAVLQFLPVLIGIFVFGDTGNESGGPWFELLALAVPILYGIARYLTTRYRITATHIELRRGLISRRLLRAPLDRVRTVALDASLIHRVLGLEKVRIGTGDGGGSLDDAGVELDSLAAPAARELRTSLLHRARHEGPADTRTESAAAESEASETDEVLLTLDPAWVRYAPLTSAGLIATGVLFGALSQFGRFLSEQRAADAIDWFAHLSVVVLVAVALVAVAITATVLPMLGYLTSNWGFTLSRDREGRSLKVRRGLFSTTETSAELKRVRGVQLSEPLGLRFAGSGRLYTLASGLKTEAGGTIEVVPPAPRAELTRVGEDLTERGAMTLALIQHGPAARARRWFRAFWFALVLLALILAATLWLELSWWLPILVAGVLLPASAWLAEDRYRRLGHALTPRHFVARHGSLNGKRVALDRDGIIGWNLTQTWFQRRSGLLTLTATTSAGSQAYSAVDIPVRPATQLAREALPELMDQFVEVR